jgi:hypothetical protein
VAYTSSVSFVCSGRNPSVKEPFYVTSSKSLKKAQGNSTVFICGVIVIIF